MPRLQIAMTKYFVLFFIGWTFFAANANADWNLIKSDVKYKVTHPLHKIIGTSQDARGKGVCSKAECEFLVAAPIKSFTSNSTNRDLHVMEVVGAALNPMVQFRLKTVSEKLISPLKAKVEVTLNGQVAKREIIIEILKNQDETISANGHIQFKLTEFKIEPPSLLAVPVRDELIIDFSSQWQKNK